MPIADHKRSSPGLAAGTASGGQWSAEAARSGTILLSICAVVTIVLGIYRIGHYSIWLDEYTTLMATGSYDLLIGYLKAFPEQHPVYYLFIKWLGVNKTLMGIRLFSLACGVLAIFPFYFIGRRVFSAASAGFACIFFALSPFLLYYNQEGRMYTLFVLLALIQVAFLVKWSLDGNPMAKVGFTVISILSLYTHFFTLFLLATEFVWILAMKIGKTETRIRFGQAIGLYLLVGVAYIPWLLHIFSNLGSMSQNWRGAYNIAFLIPYTFFRFAAGYGIFPLNYDVKRHLAEYLPVALFWGAAFCLAYLPAAVVAARRMRRVTSLQSLVYCIAFIPIILVVAASFFKNVASERYVIYSAPFFYLIVASVREPGGSVHRLRQTFALGMPILLFILGVGFNYFNPAFGKTNYKAAAALIRSDSGQSVSTVVCNPDVAVGPMQYYLKDKALVTGYRFWQPPDTGSDIWLVERLATTTKPLQLAAGRYRKVMEKVFPQENGLRVTRWRHVATEGS